MYMINVHLYNLRSLRLVVIMIVLAILMLPTVASADAVKIDKIWYILDINSKTAQVTRNPSSGEYKGSYSGKVTILEKVKYNSVDYSVTSIGDLAFRNCDALTSLTIPNSVTSIGYNAFERCAFTSLTIPNSVTSIGSYAFYECFALTSIEIPNSVKSLGSSAFYGCTKLASVIIQDGITSIWPHAFSGCTGPNSVTIPQSVTNIGSYAFDGCSSLTSVTIPKSVNSIGIQAFSGCTGLESIKSNAVTPPSCDETTFENNDFSIPLYVPFGSKDAYLAAKGWKNYKNIKEFDAPTENTIDVEIDDIWYIFDEDTKTAEVKGILNKNLYNVTIPTKVTYGNVDYNVTSIGSKSFYGRGALTSVGIPHSVTTIGEQAFYGCSGIITITIPNGVTSIGDMAFAYCMGLSSLVIPQSVTSIGMRTFSGCTGLKFIKSYAQTPPTNDGTTFKDNDYTIPLYVQLGSKDAYAAADGWKNYINIIEFGNPLSGRFSVAADKRVMFSPGNLQYNADADEWKFSESQYDMIGESNVNISSTFGGWIDLFGWGTSGYNGKQPYMTSDNEYDYGDGANDLTDTNYDWGVYANISNASSIDWRTLAADEWTYLLQTRAGAADKQGHATVAGTKGLILIPDTWQQPEGLSFTPTLSDWITNTYTAVQWVEMEAAGAVFLPAGGRRTDGGSIMSLGDKSRGYYWTATASGEDRASYLRFGNTTNAPTLSTEPRSYGFAVRPVHEFILGDASGNGHVDADDIKTVVDYIMTGKTVGFNFDNADLNGDKKVNAADLVLLINKVK